MSDGLTGLVVANNLMTIGALRAIRTHGLRIPEDIAIVTIDDPYWAEFVEPPLTAFAQPVRRMAESAFRCYWSALGDREIRRRRWSMGSICACGVRAGQPGGRRELYQPDATASRAGKHRRRVRLIRPGERKRRCRGRDEGRGIGESSGGRFQRAGHAPGEPVSVVAGGIALHLGREFRRGQRERRDGDRGHGRGLGPGSGPGLEGLAEHQYWRERDGHARRDRGTGRDPAHLADGPPQRLAKLVFRCYWDGEETPSIETPLGDFFCNGWCVRTQHRFAAGGGEPGGRIQLLLGDAVPEERPDYGRESGARAGTMAFTTRSTTR